ncbi:ExbD/TolR family protein [bacterium]
MKKNISKPKIVSGINITPLTDIALVLLVIFMVTTPMLIESQIKVNLPKALKTRQELEKGILVVIDDKSRVFINDKKVNLSDLNLAFKALITEKPNMPIVINADKDVKYDTVIKVIDTARTAGAVKFSLGIEVAQT